MKIKTKRGKNKNNEEGKTAQHKGKENEHGKEKKTEIMEKKKHSAKEK